METWEKTTSTLRSYRLTQSITTALKSRKQNVCGHFLVVGCTSFTPQETQALHFSGRLSVICDCPSSVTAEIVVSPMSKCRGITCCPSKVFDACCDLVLDSHSAMASGPFRRHPLVALMWAFSSFKNCCHTVATCPWKTTGYEGVMVSKENNRNQ